MIKKLWKENKGFTLIEIVITTVVLATISIKIGRASCRERV